MPAVRSPLARVLMIVVPSLIGLGVLAFAGNFRRLPEATETNRPPALVRIITLAPVDLTPRVTGYGVVMPSREWRAIARVPGDVMEIADGLAAGDLIPQGTALFTLDDRDLKLELAGIDARLASYDVKTATLNASQRIAASDLELAQADLSRQERLNKQGVVTQSALEMARRTELAARTKVVDYDNQLKLNAAERDVLQTQRASLLRELDFTTLIAPYDLRVNSVAADVGQYVAQGQVLLTGEGVDSVDITAQFPMGRIGPLLRLTGEGTVVTDLKARVSLPLADHPVIWKAIVARMGDAIDSKTQNAPVIVKVDTVQAPGVAGERPPLRRNMIVAVELIAPQISALVVPAEAVSTGTALVIVKGKLVKRPVTTRFVSGDLAVIATGLEPGDQLVITDPSIAVPGMSAQGIEDETRKAQITALAGGGSAIGSKKGAGNGKDAEPQK